MMPSLIRRLERLETGGGSRLPLDLPARLEAARKRARTMTPEELRRERGRRLVEMRAAHAIKPLRGLALRLLNAAERMHRYEAQDRTQTEAGA